MVAAIGSAEPRPTSYALRGSKILAGDAYKSLWAGGGASASASCWRNTGGRRPVGDGPAQA